MPYGHEGSILALQAVVDVWALNLGQVTRRGLDCVGDTNEERVYLEPRCLDVPEQLLGEDSVGAARQLC